MKHLCSLLLIAVLSVLPALAQPELRNGIVALANEAIVTFQDVEVASTASIDSAYRAHGPNSAQFRQRVNEARNDAVEQLVERHLVLSDFKTGGRVLPESIIDERIKEIIRERYGNRVTLTKTLQAENTTFESFRQRIRDDVIYSVMDRHNVREAILISPMKIERAYQTNLARFQLADQVRLRVIVLKRAPGGAADEVRALATEIWNKVQGGASFAEMASVHSEGSQRKEGGDWGWFEESKLSRGFAEVAAPLKTGEVSGVFSLGREASGSYWIYAYDRTGKIISGRQYTDKESFVEEKKFDQAGHDGIPAQPLEFYLLKVDEKKSAYTRPLIEVRDVIERELVAQERTRLRQQWITRLRAKSFVRYF